MAMRITITLLILLNTIFATDLSAQKKNGVLAVQQILKEQQADWNRGDVDAFMQHYWKSDQLQFIGSSGMTSGWQETLDNYKRRYPDRQAMGNLKFDILEVNQRSRKVISLVGKFHLTRAEAIGDLSGHFLLIFQKIKGKWKIVADHTS